MNNYTSENRVMIPQKSFDDQYNALIVSSYKSFYNYNGLADLSEANQEMLAAHYAKFKPCLDEISGKTLDTIHINKHIKGSLKIAQNINGSEFSTANNRVDFYFQTHGDNEGILCSPLEKIRATVTHHEQLVSHSLGDSYKTKLMSSNNTEFFEELTHSMSDPQQVQHWFNNGYNHFKSFEGTAQFFNLENYQEIINKSLDYYKGVDGFQYLSQLDSLNSMSENLTLICFSHRYIFVIGVNLFLSSGFCYINFQNGNFSGFIKMLRKEVYNKLPFKLKYPMDKLVINIRNFSFHSFCTAASIFLVFPQLKTFMTFNNRTSISTINPMGRGIIRTAKNMSYFVGNLAGNMFHGLAQGFSHGLGVSLPAFTTTIFSAVTESTKTGIEIVKKFLENRK